MGNNCVSIKKLEIRCHIDTKVLFELVFLLIISKAYRMILATVELTNDKPILTLHKWFLDINVVKRNITVCQLMQCPNVTKLTPEQFEQLLHKLPNYTIANYDL